MLLFDEYSSERKRPVDDAGMLAVPSGVLGAVLAHANGVYTHITLPTREDLIRLCEQFNMSSSKLFEFIDKCSEDSYLLILDVNKYKRSVGS